MGRAGRLIPAEKEGTMKSYNDGDFYKGKPQDRIFITNRDEYKLGNDNFENSIRAYITGKKGIGLQIRTFLPLMRRGNLTTCWHTWN